MPRRVIPPVVSRCSRAPGICLARSASGGEAEVPADRGRQEARRQPHREWASLVDEQAGDHGYRVESGGDDQ
jgi:hypothetical protein